MPSLIPNYIARFRTHSQSTAGPSSTASQSAPTASDSVPDASSSYTNIPYKPSVPIAQRIHPDQSALLQDAPPPLSSVPKTDPPGLRPPRRRSDSAGKMMTVLSTTQQPDVDMPTRDPLLSTNSGSTVSSRFRATSQTASSSKVDPQTPPQTNPPREWSTFGRKPLSARLGLMEIGNRRRSGSKSRKPSIRSTKQAATVDSPGLSRAPSIDPNTPSRSSHPPSAHTAPSRRSTDLTHSSIDPPSTSSPAGTVGSSDKSYSTQSHASRRKRVPPLSAPMENDLSASSASTPPPPPPSFTPLLSGHSNNKSIAVDSPHTFGRPTPKTRVAGSALQGAFAGDESLHHEQNTSDPWPTMPSGTPDRERDLSATPPSTFPGRSSGINTSGVFFPSLPISFNRSSPSGKRPRADEMFDDSPESQSTPKGLGRFRLGSLTSVGSNTERDEGQRRNSANWSALQVNNGSGTWPAEVSRGTTSHVTRRRSRLFWRSTTFFRSYFKYLCVD